MGQEASTVKYHASRYFLNRLEFSTQDLEQLYSVSFTSAAKLGEGTFGTVWRVTHLETGEVRAVKKLDKSRVFFMRIPREDVLLEMELLRKCIHKNICRSYEAFESQKQFHFIMEYCDGGDLQQQVQGTTAGSISEDTVAQFMRQILEAIAYLHARARNIIHRDIKPHNFMIRGEMLKLGDFGIAIQPEGLLQKKVGSPAFMAPEIHLLPDKSVGYDHKVDVWAAGVCMVFLLSSQCPFIDSQNKLLRDAIISGNVPLWEDKKYFGLFRATQLPQGPSQQARLLVRALLKPDKEKRLTASEAVAHPWFFAQETGTLVAVQEPEPLLSSVDFQQTSVPLNFPLSKEFTQIKDLAHSSVTMAHDVAQGGLNLVKRFLALPANDIVFSSDTLQAHYNVSPTPENLGEGMFGCAYKAHPHGDPTAPRAIITLHKRQLTAQNVARADILTEIKLIRSCVHKNIVHLFDCFEDDTQFHFVLDYMDGGNLQQRLDHQKRAVQSPFAEDISALWIRQLLEALSYLHTNVRGRVLVHRNVKPRTCMFRGEMLKLTDFDLAAEMPSKQGTQQPLLTDVTGSPAFMAPELHLLHDRRSAGYDTKVDIWASGCVLCMLLTLQCPFVDAESGLLLREQLLRGDVAAVINNGGMAAASSSRFRKLVPWGGGAKNDVTDQARSVLKMMLVPDRHRRASGQEVIAHAWFLQAASSGM
eukprot:GEMP01009951.1.p1 GENE.GEMP01009951.1~~GEMP01009951.1.p1  ORF type:complete len:701 (+),score=169.59 GEMP01009951.1:126-2228(+)